MRELLIYLKLGLTPILTALLLMLNACSRSFVQEEIFSDSKDVITDIQVLEYMGYDLLFSANFWTFDKKMPYSYARG